MSERITIVQLNDSHGYLEDHPELFWAGDRAEHRTAGGYPRIASLLRRIRHNAPGPVLAFDCGDTIHGTYEAVHSHGEALVPLLNALGFHAMTAHWEFAYGPARFKELAAQLDYPMLAINCYDQETGELVFDPYVVLEAGRLKVGVIGIAATIVDKVMPPSFSEGIRFTLGNEELPACIEALRADEGCDLVMVISHLGFPQEMKLAAEVEGIDVLLSAHTHNRLHRPAVIRHRPEAAGDTILIQSGCHGSFLGRLDLQVEEGRIVDYSHRLITVSEDLPADPEMDWMVGQATSLQREALAEVAGHTLTPLNRNTVLEATMDNLLLQSLLDATGAHLAFSNGWRYGAPVPPGPVTMRDLWNIIPMNPPLSVCKLTGAELRAMMEESLEHTFARDPYDQMGGYVKRCMGLNLYFKVENPPGHRICELFVGREPVRPDAAYDAVFVTSQGVPAKYGSERKSLDLHAIDALRRYLGRHKPAEADLRGTVVAI